MDMASILEQMSEHMFDIALILISGIACLYCATLSRRLKNLNNLKSGVGATIVSLTQAIEDTHKAAQEAQVSTLQTVETLRHLLEKSESSVPRLEALILDMKHASENAKMNGQTADRIATESLFPAIEKAQLTASGLLKIVSDISRFKHNILAESNESAAGTIKLASQSQAASQ